jgi:hypothetical protein
MESQRNDLPVHEMVRKGKANDERDARIAVDVPQALAHMGEKERNMAKKKVHHYTGMFAANVLKEHEYEQKAAASFKNQRGQPAGVCKIPNSARPSHQNL